MTLYTVTWIVMLLAGTGCAAATLGWPRRGFALALILGAGTIYGMLLGGVVVGLVAGDETSTIVVRSLPVLGLVAALAWYLAWRRRPTMYAVALDHNQRKSLWVVLGLVVLMAGLRLVPIFNEVLLRPVFPWDAWSVWMVKPKAWFLSAHMDRFVDPVAWFASDHGLRTLAGANYPELSAHLQLLLATALGEWNEPLLLLPWPVLFIALTLAFAGICRRLGCSPIASLCGCYALASLPLLNAQIALAGYLDIWIGAVLMLAAAAWLLWRRERRPALLILALLLAGSMVLLKLEGVVWLALLLSVMAFDSLSPHWQRRALWFAAMGIVAFFVIAIVLGGWIDAHIQLWNVPGIRKLSLAWRPGGLVIVVALFTHANWHLLGLLLVGLPLLRWRQFKIDVEARLLGLLVLIAWIALLVLFCLTPAAEWAVRQTATNRLVLQLAPVMLLWLALLVRGWDPLQLGATGRSQVA